MHSGFIPSDIACFLSADQQKTDTDKRSNDAEILKLLHIQSSPLRHIDSFALLPNQTLAKPLPPHTTRVLSSQCLEQLKSLYEQLYLGRTVAHMSHFYRQHGRVSLSGDIIDCVMPGSNTCQSSSVIAAYWPGSGSSLRSADYTQKRIGVVQYFIHHSVEFYVHHAGGETEKLQHLFCYVYWKKQHPNANWFGISAVVCDDCFESPEACCFIPIQRITNKCAFAKQNVKLDSYEDSVFVFLLVQFR